MPTCSLMKNKFSFLFFILLPLFLSAQTTRQQWSLEQCIDYALEHNLTVQKSLLDKAKAGINNNTARNGFLPVVNAQAKNENNWGLFVDPSTNILTRQSAEIYVGSVVADFQLFNGGYTFYNIQETEALNKAAGYDYAGVRNEIRVRTSFAYYQLLLANEQLKIAESLKERNELQLQQTIGSVKAGIIHKREQSLMEAEVGLSEVEIIKASNLIKTSTLQLYQVMGLPADTSIIIEPVADSDIVNQSANGSNISLSNFPQLTAANYRITAATYSIKRVQASRYPSLHLTTGVITRSSSLLPVEKSQQFKDNRSEFVTFNLYVPLFTQFQMRNKIALAKLEMKIQENESRQQRMEIERNLQTAILEAELAQKKYLALSKQVNALEEQNLFAQKSFSAGTMSFNEYSLVSNKYLNAQIQAIAAKYDFLLRKKVIEIYSQRYNDF